jgi:hypothetical protein
LAKRQKTQVRYCSAGCPAREVESFSQTSGLAQIEHFPILGSEVEYRDQLSSKAVAVEKVDNQNRFGFENIREVQSREASSKKQQWLIQDLPSKIRLRPTPGRQPNAS